MAKGQKSGGRQKGTPNKTTAALKDLILGALADAGGQEYLKQQATANPNAFLALVGKVLPLQVKSGGSDPVVPTVVKHVYETVKGDERV